MCANMYKLWQEASVIIEVTSSMLALPWNQEFMKLYISTAKHTLLNLSALRVKGEQVVVVSWQR